MLVRILLLVLLVSACAEKENSPRKRRASGADATPQPGVSPVPSGVSTTTLPGPGPTVIPSGIQPVTPQAPSPESACHKADKFICAIELAITKQTNELRGSREDLNFSKKLGFAARKWSESMGRRGGIGHAGFPNQRMSSLNTEFGSTSGVDMSAENVAMTGASETDADAVATEFTQMWWHSSGHRRNMVGNYKALGVGVYSTGDGSYYATQIFGDAD